MQITIDLSETGYPMRYDPEEGEAYPTGSIQDAILTEVATQVRKQLKEIEEPAIRTIRKEISEARQEAVRVALSEQIQAAMGEPIHRTNHYGEPTGPETTLREMVVAEVKGYLEEKIRDGYSSRESLTRAEQVVKKMVDEEIRRELTTELERAKMAAVEVVRETTSEVIEKKLREKLRV